MKLTTSIEYQNLLDRISNAYTKGRNRTHHAVFTDLIAINWQIGQHIVEFEQGGSFKADNGTELLTRLCKDLTLRHGKGFSSSNLVYMRLLYLRYPKSLQTSDVLSWSQYVDLLKTHETLERSFYENQSITDRDYSCRKQG